MGKIVGIDLGTSTSEIAVYDADGPRILPNTRGNRVTPSAVWLSPSGEVVTGELAYRQPNAVKQYKRLMGTGKLLDIGGKELRPEECTALMLKYLVESAEQVLGEPVDSAVLTVPANWKDDPRRATEAAGQLAGIRVERLINEPTAAAMAFGIRPEADGKVIAVYDFGGGTFDVTLLQIEDLVFDVLTSNGDQHLGGADIDRLLVEHVVSRHNRREARKIDLERDVEAVHQLLLACEEAKRELSFRPTFDLMTPFLPLADGSVAKVEQTITAAELKELIAPLVDRTLAYVEKALRDARLDRSAIDEIVMVGGSSRIPAVRERVAEYFGKEPSTTAVNPDEAVALGAAIQAEVIREARSGKETTTDSIVVLDVASASLGVEVVSEVNGRLLGDVFSVIIPKDTKLPASNTEEYATASDYQEKVEIRCYQGEHPRASMNTPIGRPIVIDGLPPRPAGEIKVHVTFGLDVNGMLTVTGEVRELGKVASAQIEIGRALYDGEELESRREQLEELWKGSSLSGRYRKVIERAEETLSAGAAGKMEPDLRAALEELKKAVVEEDEEAAEAADLRISEILFELE